MALYRSGLVGIIIEGPTIRKDDTENFATIEVLWNLERPQSLSELDLLTEFVYDLEIINTKKTS